MKRITILFLILSFSSLAQHQKIGTIDSKAVLPLFPENTYLDSLYFSYQKKSKITLDIQLEMIEDYYDEVQGRILRECGPYPYLKEQDSLRRMTQKYEETKLLIDEIGSKIINRIRLYKENEIQEAISIFAQTNNFDLVLDKCHVSYNSQQNEITPEIVKILKLRLADSVKTKIQQLKLNVDALNDQFYTAKVRHSILLKKSLVKFYSKIINQLSQDRIIGNNCLFFYDLKEELVNHLDSKSIYPIESDKTLNNTIHFHYWQKKKRKKLLLSSPKKSIRYAYKMYHEIVMPDTINIILHKLEIVQQEMFGSFLFRPTSPRGMLASRLVFNKRKETWAFIDSNEITTKQLEHLLYKFEKINAQ